MQGLEAAECPVVARAVRAAGGMQGLVEGMEGGTAACVPAEGGSVAAWGGAQDVGSWRKGH